MYYSMAAYRNNSFLGDADYTLSDTINGYTTVYKVDSIQPGMSAKVYVAFEKILEGNNYYMIYDEGYITSDIKGSVYTNVAD